MDMKGATAEAVPALEPGDRVWVKPYKAVWNGGVGRSATCGTVVEAPEGGLVQVDFGDGLMTDTRYRPERLERTAWPVVVMVEKGLWLEDRNGERTALGEAVWDHTAGVWRWHPFATGKAGESTEYPTLEALVESVRAGERKREEGLMSSVGGEMRVYVIEVTETWTKPIWVEAASSSEAERIAEALNAAGIVDPCDNGDCERNTRWRNEEPEGDDVTGTPWRAADVPA